SGDHAPIAATGGRYTGNPTAAASSAPAPSLTPPLSFNDAKAAVLVNSDAAGCTSLHRDGWVQVTCDAETLARGRAVKATLKEGGIEDQSELMPLPDGRLQLVLPWQPAKRALALLEFSKGSFELATNNATGAFRRMLPRPQGEACDKLAAETSARLKKLREAESGPVRQLDLKRFPKLGKCEIWRDDAWAFELADVRGVGESVEREVSLTLNVTHVDPSGAVARAAWGPLVFAPGRVAISDVSLLDYDSDGAAEVIVRYEVLARGERAERRPQAHLPRVFTYKQKRVTPYAPAGVGGQGGAVAEQLEDDGRPDLGDYGPYVAWLGAGCGV